MAKKKGALPGKKQQKTTQKNQTTTTKQETKKHKKQNKKKRQVSQGGGCWTHCTIAGGWRLQLDSFKSSISSENKKLYCFSLRSSIFFKKVLSQLLQTSPLHTR
jgi:Tfp pilus tip-associated adhesin PilY1